MQGSRSYLSPKLESRPHPQKGGWGVFAIAPIQKGELLALWGGRIVSASELDFTLPNFTKVVLQIDDEFYLLSEEVEPADHFNHSCDPNAGFFGQIGLVAMRDIAPGEEVCFDYAMCDSSPYDEFECHCGSPHCRGYVSGDDWKRPELWERYEGYFSPYLARRIKALKAQIYVLAEAE
ncbi:MAG: SET domain-containing protein [Anaerolineales bacterium]